MLLQEVQNEKVGITLYEVQVVLMFCRKRKTRRSYCFLYAVQKETGRIALYEVQNNEVVLLCIKYKIKRSHFFV